MLSPAITFLIFLLFLRKKIQGRSHKICFLIPLCLNLLLLSVKHTWKSCKLDQNLPIFTAFSLPFTALFCTCGTMLSADSLAVAIRRVFMSCFRLISAFYRWGENTHIKISTLTVIFLNYSCFSFSHSIQHFSDFNFYLFFSKLLFIYLFMLIIYFCKFSFTRVVCGSSRTWRSSESLLLQIMRLLLQIPMRLLLFRL